MPDGVRHSLLMRSTRPVDDLMRLKRVLGAKPDQTRALMPEKHS